MVAGQRTARLRFVVPPSGGLWATWEKPPEGGTTNLRWRLSCFMVPAPPGWGTGVKTTNSLVRGMLPRTPSDAEACCLLRDVGDKEIPASDGVMGNIPITSHYCIFMLHGGRAAPMGNWCENNQ